jgi:hypothetical protein
MNEGTSADDSKQRVEYVGIVVIMDALGTRTLSSSGATQFLNDRDRLISFLDLLCSDVLEIAQHAQLHTLMPKQTIRTFGDTIICAYSDPNVASPAELLPLVGAIVAPVIFTGLELGLLLRGALSIGSYVMDETTVVGQAITDAANWYEKADWIGIICTPSASLKLQAERGVRRRDDLHVALFEWFERDYPVPLILHDVAGNHRYTEKLVSVKWPLFYRICLTEFESGRKFKDRDDYFLTKLAEFPVPYGTESKYFNTAHYYDRVFSRDGGLCSRMTKFYRRFKESMFLSK